jgi:hypothetical protein
MEKLRQSIGGQQQFLQLDNPCHPAASDIVASAQARSGQRS